jgi:hypothetical protein
MQARRPPPREWSHVTAVVFRLRAELRTRWRAWLAVAAIAGLGAAVVLTLLAGARRTEAAYREFATAQDASDVLLAGRSDFGLIGSVDLDDVAQLPEVRATSRAYAPLLFTGRTSAGLRVGPGDLFPVAPEDARLGTEIERWKLLEGRRADPDRVDEATASFVLADRLHLEVGDTIRLHFVKADSFIPVAATLLAEFGPRLRGAPGSEASTIDRLADGPDITFRIVGIEASPAEFPPLAPDLSPALHLTPAFTRAHAHDVVGSPIMYTVFDRRDQLDSFSSNVERLAPGEPVGFVVSRRAQTVKVLRSIEVQAAALRVVAALTLLALVLVVAQALVRQAFVESAEDDVYRALGLSRAQVLTVAAGAGAFIAVAAAVVAVAGAYLASPLMPIGLARTADVHPGMSFDGLVLGAGALGILAVVPLLALYAEWRVAAIRRRESTFSRRPAVDRVLGDRAIPPTASVGVRFALDPGRGAGAVPVWTAVLGSILALVLLVGTWSFRESLHELLDTPALYGWNWDVKTGAPALPDISSALAPAFAEDQAVDAFAEGTVIQGEIADERVDLLALDQRQRAGTVAPTVLEGRLPRSANEVALGTTTLERLDEDVAGRAAVRVGSTVAGFRIVGRVVFPDYGDAARLGEGALVTMEGVRRLVPDARVNVFLLRFRDGVGRRETLERLRTALEPLPSRASGRPRELTDLSRVRGLPLVLAAIVGALAAATLAHALVTSVRRRRRDLAIVKTLGFRRRQVGFAVAWQTTTLVTLALAIGIPLGMIAGRAAWNAFADGLGVPRAPAYPWELIVATVPVALLLGNAIAAIPAWIAGRTRPAVVFRSG